MNAFSIISFLVSLFCVYLGIKILLNNFKNGINILFSLICLSLFIWSAFLSIASFIGVYEKGFIYVKFAYVGRFFFSPLNLHFCLILSKAKSKRWQIVSFYLPAIILSAAFLSGFTFFKNFYQYKDIWIGVLNFNIWVLLFVIYNFLCLILSCLALISWGKNTKSKKEKIYSRSILIAISFATITTSTLAILFPFLGIYELQPLGLTIFYLYIIAVFFLISKFRFMNLNYSLMAEEIISHINDMVILLDKDFKVIDANNKFRQALSREASEIKNRYFFEFVDESAWIEIKLKELVEKEIDSVKLRVQYKNNDDAIITNTYVSRIKDKFGDITGFFVISSEVKEIKQFQKYFKITGRELEIIELIISGFTYKDAANKLSLAEKTVESHLTNIYNKLGINNKIELIKVTGDFNIKPFFDQ